MLASFELFLKNLSSEIITDVFFGIMLIVLFLGVIAFLTSRSDKTKRRSIFAEYAPVLLTSLGILGTFTGIVSGLLNFDINNIDTSISTLLGGMKTAFITSVIGVCFSIGLKIIYTLGVKKERIKEDQSVDIESIIKNFYAQTDELKKQNSHNEKIISHLADLIKCFGNDSDSTVLGQIKLLRSDLSDQHKNFINDVKSNLQPLSAIEELLKNNQKSFQNFESQLWLKLQNFADMMSKSATEAVIEALKKVIIEFNNNLTTQFGENFKELNAAVRLLVEWQENYKNQLSEMIMLYDTGVQTLESTEKSISLIEQATQSIPNTMTNLGEVITVNQHQIENLSSHLTAFEKLKDKAVEAIPQIQQHISLMLENTEKANVSLINGLKQSSQSLEQEIAKISHELAENASNANKSIVNTSTTLENTASQLLENQQAINKAQKAASEQIINIVSQWHQAFEQQSQQLHSQFVQTAKELMKSQMDDSRKVMNRLEEESEQALKRTGESVNKQIQALDKALEEELKKVMTDMGRALASISHQFTSDYVKLVDAMNRVTSKGRF